MQQIKRPFLAGDRFAQKYRAGLELLIVLLIGVMSIVIAFQTNLIAEGTKKVTEKQSAMMEQQLHLQTVNTLPNFVLEEYFVSPVGERQVSSMTVANTGGWARYAELAVKTYVRFGRNLEDGSWRVIAEVPATHYFQVVEVDQGTDGEAFRWLLSSATFEDTLEDFLVDLENSLRQEYEIDGVTMSLEHRLVVTYVDFQGVTHTENYRFMGKISENPEEIDKYLRPVAPGDSQFVTQENMYSTVGIPSYIRLSYPQRGEQWFASVESVGREIFERYGNPRGSYGTPVAEVVGGETSSSHRSHQKRNTRVK